MFSNENFDEDENILQRSEFKRNNNNERILPAIVKKNLFY